MSDEMKMLSLEDIDNLGDCINTDTVHIKGVEGAVTVRGLSRAEMHLLTKKDGGKPSAETSDIFYLVHGVVNPKMEERHARKLMTSLGFNVLSPVISKISELSGVDKEAQKEAYKSLRE
jgi:hypothetical protein